MLIIAIHFLSSVGLTLFFTLYFGLVSSWLDFWIPLLIFVGSFLFFTILYFAHLQLNHMTANMKKQVEKPSRYAQHIFRFGVSYVLTYARARVHVINGSMVEPGQKYVFISNHRSSFDPMVLANSFRKNKMAFVSKPSNFKIPLCGGIVYKCGCIPLNREDPREGFRAIKHAAELVKNNDLSMAIYPEGTRNTSDALLPFKSGAFRLPQLADVPICVVAVRGTEFIHRNFPWRHTDIYIKIVEVIPLEKVRNTNSNVLAEEVREKLETAVKELYEI